MSFCAIFIALLLERFFDYSHLRHWRWFPAYQKFILGKCVGKSPAIVLAALIGLALIGLFIVEVLMAGVLFGFVKLFISFAIILYCFGPRNLWADIFACLIDIANGDARGLVEKLKVSFGVVPTNGPEVMHRELLTAVFIQANRRVFAIIFWFSLLGVYGVVAYRLLSLIVGEAGKEHSDPRVADLARQYEAYMDWPAVRVLGLLFALGGNFTRVFAVWRQSVSRGVEANDTLIVECGMSTLNAASLEVLPIDGSAEKEQVALLDRSFAIMLVFIALLVFWIP